MSSARDPIEELMCYSPHKLKNYVKLRGLWKKEMELWDDKVLRAFAFVDSATELKPREDPPPTSMLEELAKMVEGNVKELVSTLERLGKSDKIVRPLQKASLIRYITRASPACQSFLRKTPVAPAEDPGEGSPSTEVRSPRCRIST